MAVFSVPVEPAHGRGDAGRPRHLGDARDDPAMGPQIRPGIRHPDPSRAPRRGDKWHLDELVISVAGKKHWLWRAVDRDGFVLDVLVQSRRDKEAAKRLFRKLLKKQGRAPRVLVTDKLKSYAAARREIMPGVEHRQHKGLNNRAENSHQPTRRRERIMKRFKSPRQVQRSFPPMTRSPTFSPVVETTTPPQTSGPAAPRPSPPGPKSLVSLWLHNHAYSRASSAHPAFRR